MLGLALGVGTLLAATAPWGFYGHRLINRMAVFTLPPEMVGFYKANLGYITEHAVDPDKRRYATRFEAIRHYIDLDQWGQAPFLNLPRDWTGVLMRHTSFEIPATTGDTAWLEPDSIIVINPDSIGFSLRFKSQTKHFQLPADCYREFFGDNILPLYYEEDWIIDTKVLSNCFGTEWPKWPLGSQAFGKDHFSQHGILPYFLPQIQRQLTEAFKQKNASRILRLSAEIGHYIGDAHVPLHTTKNYNGQLSNQVGIHAFWESRIPELFAESSYDFFVGPAKYVKNLRSDFWQIVFDSHELVDSVLQIEKRLSVTYPTDQQYCFEERLGATVKTQCRAYAEAYHEAMSGMVEDRLRAAILAVGSAWYTAWVDAGQPDLSDLYDNPLSKDELEEEKLLNQQYQNGKELGRPHE